MPDHSSVSDLLLAQTERKLVRMRAGILNEIDRLRIELKMVDEAIGKKKPRTAKAEPATSAPAQTTNGGKPADGLSRAELLLHVSEVGHPVKAAEMRDVLATKGIFRRVEAVRNGLVRLEGDGKLVRDSEGRFGVAGTGGGGGETEDQSLAGPVSLVEGADA
jgi:hypothetical protein